MRKPKKHGCGCGTFLILLIVVCLGVYFFVGEGSMQLLRAIYPIKYQDSVEKYAKENGLDPYLIYAVIWAESKFDPNAVSSENARGLMQLMDETARECADRLQVEIQIPDDLYDPDTNIMLGASYLKRLMDHYDDLNLVLMAYNGGWGNVRKWLNDEELSDGNGGLTEIPFEETEKYVKRVLRAYDRYKQLYA